MYGMSTIIPNEKKYKSKKNEDTKYKTEQHTNAATYQLIRVYRREC